jgi:hypothetical protein
LALNHAWAVAVMIAVTVCASTSVLIVLGRRTMHHGDDLGTVSPHWIAHHREQPTRDSW